MRALLCLLLLAVFWARTTPVHGTRFSITTHTPPFIQRIEDKGVVQWDTGDLAKELALTSAVVVNYQGVRMVPHAMHVALGTRLQHAGVRCTEYSDALCRVPFYNYTVFPSAGDIHVPVSVDYRGSHTLENLLLKGCDGLNTGVGRIQSDSAQYDISACDIDSMHWMVFLHGDTMYIIPSPFEPWQYLLLSVSSVITLSGMLYLLNNESKNVQKQQKQTDGFLSLSVLDWVLVNASLSSVWVVIVQTQYDTFVTTEERASFYLAAFVCFFYIIAALTERLRGTSNHKYEAGLVMDACASSVSIVSIAAYSSLDHPFHMIVLGALLFRVWNKLIRFSHGDGFAPNASVVALRLTLDSVLVCVTTAYGWNTSFHNSTVAACWYAALLYAVFAAAKYVFLFMQTPLS